MPENRAKTETKRKLASTAYAKGVSGNPGGRPTKTAEQRSLEAMCKDKTPDAMETVLRIMASGEQEGNQLKAAQYVIDRGWGKAKESIEHSGTMELSIADQIKAAHAALK